MPPILPLLVANCGWLFLAALVLMAMAMCLQLRNMKGHFDSLKSDDFDAFSPFKGIMPVIFCGVTAAGVGILAVVGFVVMLIEKYG